MLFTTFILAFRSIRRHLMRSFLTTLGIVIGVAAVITMVTLGQATTLAVQKQIASLGNNILLVRPGQGFGRGGGGPQPPDFDAQDVAAVRDQIAGITAVAPQASSAVTAPATSGEGAYGFSFVLSLIHSPPCGCSPGT